ncbi:HNH endonuclease [Pseudomonas sp. B26(2017)]|uniref:HNH endonuclease n=1 Tax=Pseudomonas sp. B26(2017) TaxID=1981732 RepID=UPI000A1DD782|nr:HNH endonuclease [Pseudomonas sp. B26(2017)]
MENLSSTRLKPGMIYTRNDLSELFGIKDATLKNGIFRPKGYDSVWLFVTEQKTSDRTPYVDTLTNDTLRMEGQLQGRTDHLILKHKQLGLELLVFHRRTKKEYSGAGFRYEGAFCYEDASGSKPTSFVLKRERTDSFDADLNEMERKLVTQGTFDPADVTDSRERTFAAIVQRRGQTRFRTMLLKAYKSRCAITGCEVEPALEAAHIHPYQGDHTDVISNGLLLRSDIHTLFDLGLIWIEPTNLSIQISESIRKCSEYASLDQRLLSLPESVSDHPSQAALEFRMCSKK